eukprot:Gb_20722 [translate_table: standard]
MAKPRSVLFLFVFILFVICSAAAEVRLHDTHARVDASLFRWKETGFTGNCYGYISDVNQTKPRHGVGFPLVHIHSKCSPFRQGESSWLSLVLESVERDNHRYRKLANRLLVSLPAKIDTEDVQEPVSSGQLVNSGNYIIKVAYGTPGQSMYAVIDTGSDMTWAPCTPCSGCDSNATQPFDSSKSSSYKVLGCSSPPCVQLGSDPSCGMLNCSFTQTYGDGSTFGAVLSNDTLTLGTDSFPGFHFGCAHTQTGLIRSAPGLIGLGREPISFLSQTDKLYGKTFSYCLPSYRSPNLSGSIRLGKEALSATGLKFTPLLLNPANPSFYYVSLKGISVGDERLSISPEMFALNQSTGQGTIIDSGTVITRLVKPAYSVMRDAFQAKVSNLTVITPGGPFDTCYDISSANVSVPSITFHFENYLDLVLPEENVLFPANEDGTAVCLAFSVPPSDSSVSMISIIGNFQQQNWRILYDVPNSKLGIGPEHCLSL